MSTWNFKISSIHLFQPSPDTTAPPIATSFSDNAESPTFVIDDYDATTPDQPPPEPSHPSPPIKGSFEHDLKTYTLRWESLDAMRIWLKKEQESKTIELRLKETRVKTDLPATWVKCYFYVCARAGTGGRKAYQKKYARNRKIPVKRTGCNCRLTVKTYPGTNEVLGLYIPNHSHPVGNDNAKFTRLTEEDRAEIEHLLRLGVDPKKVVRQLGFQL